MDADLENNSFPHEMRCVLKKIIFAPYSICVKRFFSHIRKLYTSLRSHKHKLMIYGTQLSCVHSRETSFCLASFENEITKIKFRERGTVIY